MKPPRMGKIPGFSFPLLGKELVEQAARRRTYIIRVVYALLLFAGATLLFRNVLRPAYYSNYGWHYALGAGRSLFNSLVFIQFAGIFLFLPTLMAGAVTEEKEKESLALLFLTDLRPGELLLQKFVGRLVPMFTFLLLSLPLMAVAYSFGGIETNHLVNGCVALFLCCLQVGAFGLLSSTFCRTTAEAFACSYLGLVLFYLGPVLLLLSLDLLGGAPHIDEDAVFSHFPVFIFAEYRNHRVGDFLGHSWLVIASTVFMALGARAFLVKRAFKSLRNPVLLLFKKLDTVFNQWNGLVGGVEVLKQKDSLPEEEPMAWRELNKRAIGRWHYLIRLLLFIEVPLLLIAASMVMAEGNDALPILSMIVWPLAALILVVQGANLIVAERSQQTLDILLVTPMTGREIVRQKMRALMRLALILAVPLVTLAVINRWMGDYGYSWRRYRREPGLDLFVSIAAAFTYLPMLAWWSLALGLRARTRLRAMVWSVGGLVAWCTIPWAVCIAIGLTTGADPDEFPLNVMLMSSPASAVFVSLAPDPDWRDLFPHTRVVAAVLNFLFYGMLMASLRSWCLHNADRILRRK